MNNDRRDAGSIPDTISVLQAYSLRLINPSAENTKESNVCRLFFLDYYFHWQLSVIKPQLNVSGFFFLPFRLNTEMLSAFNCFWSWPWKQNGARSFMIHVRLPTEGQLNVSLSKDDKIKKKEKKIVVFCSTAVVSWHQGMLLSGWFISTCSLFQMGEFPEGLILCFLGSFPPLSQHPCEPTYRCYCSSFASMIWLGLTPPCVYCKWVQIGKKI